MLKQQSWSESRIYDLHLFLDLAFELLTIDMGAHQIDNSDHSRAATYCIVQENVKGWRTWY